MLQGPVPVTKKIFGKTGMGVDDIDLFECNEAMGSIMPMWQREFDVPLDKVNVNGSGISLGHPVGATGARMTVTLLPWICRGEFRRRFESKGRFGSLMQTIPTFAITHPQPGLLGAAAAAADWQE